MNFIQKLNSIDIKDLQKIDSAQVKEWIKSSPNNLIKILLILATIFATIYIYRHNKGAEQKFSQEVKLLEEKLTAFNESEKIKKSFNEYIEEFPKSITSTKLVNNIAEIAAKHSVRIEEFSPAKNVDHEYMQLTTVSIDISTNDFQNIIHFVKDVEEADYAVRIEEFSSELDTSRSRYKKDNKEEEGIAAAISISAIKLNDKI